MNRSTSLLLACAAAAVAGCASMTDADCRGANWHALGERDALAYGMRPQIDQYVHQCVKFGVQPSEKDYMQGWHEGDGERQRRMPVGGGAL